MELVDAKGYRAKYINALNEASKRHRVVGGDVIPEEAEGGTLLRLLDVNPRSRFDLFYGVGAINKAGLLEATIAVGDGSFFVGGKLVKLKNATNCKYFTKGLRPRSSGWASKGAPENGSSGNAWNTCDVVILKYSEAYYIGFRYDDKRLYTLISEDATEEIEENIQIVLVIGTFSNSDGTIVQNVNFDIFYNEAVAVQEELKPFEVKVLGTRRVGDDQSSHTEYIVGIRNGMWTYAEWITKKEAQDAGVDASTYPKLKIHVLTLDWTFEGTPTIYDKDGNAFFDISDIYNSLELGKTHEIHVSVSVSEPLQAKMTIGWGEISGFGAGTRYGANFVRIAEAQISLMGSPIRNNIHTFTGDIVDEVKEEGVRLYSKQNATGSGYVYEDAYGTPFDSSKEYLLASMLRVDRRQDSRFIWSDIIPNAFRTLIPVTSHSADHVGGIL